MKTRIILLLVVILGFVAVAVPFWSQRATAYPLLFGRALFGPDKSNASAIVHFIVRGNDIYLDQNKDDIPQPDERHESKEFALDVDSERQADYRVHELRLIVHPEFVSETLTQQLAMTVAVSGQVSYEQSGSIMLSTNPQTPDWIQFDGQQRMIFSDPGITLSPGTETLLRVWIGTNAIGLGSELGSPPESDGDAQIPSGSVNSLDETDHFANLVPQENELLPELKIELATDGSPFIETRLLDDTC